MRKAAHTYRWNLLKPSRSAEGELEVLHLVRDDVVVQAEVHAFQQLFQLPDLYLQQHNSTFFLISYY